MVSGADLSMAFNFARGVYWFVCAVRWILGQQEPPLFDVEWRFYDSAPGARNAVGNARFRRIWRRGVEGRWVRTKERNGSKDVHRLYGGKGSLRDRKLVLNWIAEDRPDAFGVLFLTANEDSEMEGFTIYTLQVTGKTVSLPIYFKRVK